MNQDTGHADALARYLGPDFEVHVRQSGIVGVRAKPLTVTPDWGTTKVEPLEARPYTAIHGHSKSIPQGQPVPY